MKLTIIPCPFCGEQYHYTRGIARDYVDIEPHSMEGHLHVCMDGNGWYWVECANCGTRGPRQTRGPVNHRRDGDKTRKAIAGAVDSWNRRALPPTC